MKKIYALIYSILAFSFFSCSDKTTNPIDESHEWEKIEITSETTVYGFYGSLDTTLIISTLGKMLKTDDFGQTWLQVYEPLNSVTSFLKKDDTLFAVTNFDDYFSIDGGESWAILNYDILDTRTSSVTSSKGVIYKMESRSYGELAHPTAVLESRDNGTSWKEIFPYKHYIYSIYLDDKDRLYLGINGYKWNDEEGMFISSPDDRAIIYHIETGE